MGEPKTVFQNKWEDWGGRGKLLIYNRWQMKRSSHTRRRGREEGNDSDNPSKK